MSAAEPIIDAAGVPWCTREDCASYDGKRCEAVGLRPGSICEPYVIAMAEEASALRIALRNVRALASRLRCTDPVTAEHLLRFCASAGVDAEILRGGVVP